MKENIEAVQNPTYKLPKHQLLKRISKYWVFYLFMLPGILYFIAFHYMPMIGLSIAFFKFNLMGMGDFIGIDNFKEMFASSIFYSVFLNTLILSSLNISIQMFIMIVLSLLLNEVKNMFMKRTVQTIVYLPHFLSWPFVAAIFVLILSPQNGSVNAFLQMIGFKTYIFSW